MTQHTTHQLPFNSPLKKPVLGFFNLATVEQSSTVTHGCKATGGPSWPAQPVLQQAVKAGRFILLLGLLALLAACGRTPGAPALYQYATLDSLSAGVFAGEKTLGQLAAKGDTGLGTYYGLAGEMIVVDGVFYRARPDCTLERPAASEKSPLAILAFFKPQKPLSPPALPSLAALSAWLDANLPSPRVFAMVKLHATLAQATIRSVAAFEPPYPTLAQALKSQQIKQLANTSGTLVGIYSPPQYGTVGVPGWHFHFVQDGAEIGGHVLDCSIQSAQGGLMPLRRFDLELPDTRDFDTQAPATGTKEALAQETAGAKR